MNAKTTRLLKEARLLFWPWCAVILLSALPLFHINHGLSDISVVLGCLGIPMLAVLSLGNEFHHHTFSLLFTQPVSRMEIWSEKMSVTLLAALSAALVLFYCWRTSFQHDPKLWVLAGVYLLASVLSATFWTLFAKSPVGGFLLNAIFPWAVFLAYSNEVLEPDSPAVRSATSLWIVAFVALCYAGVMLWLGRRKLERFQVTGGMAGDDLLMAGPSVMPEAVAGWFRCRPTGPFLNLIRKELRLLRPIWLITPLSLVYLTGLTMFRFKFFLESAAPPPEGIQLALFTPVILFTPLIAILAGSLSLWQERTSGTQSWYLTLPISSRRQWFIKLLMAVFTGLVCAVLLPVLVMVILGFIFGSPFMFVDQAMGGLIVFGGSIFGLPVMLVGHAIPGLLLTALVLTLASFWCACAVKGTVSAALLFAPAVSAVLYASDWGGRIAPTLTHFLVSKFDPFMHDRIINAILNLQFLAMSLIPLPIERAYFFVVTLLLVPTLLLAVLQSHRLFREPARDSVLSVIRNLLPLAVTAFLSVFCWAAFPRMTDQTNGTIVSSGEMRRYLLYVPKTYDRSKPTPLVISMHGAALWPAAEMAISRWNDLADEHGFIVVYPSGTDVPKHWDEDLDVKFISSLIDKLEAEYNIDPNRIYADGMSNGGGMAFALSCRLSDRIAAVGAVAGAQLMSWAWCEKSRPVPTVAFHGTADQAALYQGGLSTIYPEPFPNIPEWTGRVARKNRCKGNPGDTRITASVRRLTYSNCAENADVILYTVEGGGHTWPGGKPLPEGLVGRTTREISATSMIWAFFMQHPRGPK
ncbi:MAG TPA: PHB depolymerase family esterase [Terriglobia bacterium]|nr:PHB depolymerase family esterase [Terriglobia bacterium]